MTQPDHKQARAYALSRLEEDLPNFLLYHSIKHTRDDVVPAAAQLAGLEGVRGEDRELLLTAAWFHDVGFIHTRAGHEAVGVRIVHEVLPDLGFSPAQLDTIGGIIMATKMPQTPRNRLEQIMADADLDSLGRDDYFAVSQDLRDELAYYGEMYTDEDWYAYQHDFLSSHSYCTPSARALRGVRKRQNIRALRRILDNLREKES
jgi:uncharacterized protein